MFKKIFVLIVAFSASLAVHAQSADSVYNKYLDFNMARFQGETDILQELGERLLPVAEKLPEKAKINFYFSIGKIYEDNGQPEKAIVFYEKVAAAVPDYYVVHRGLGYIYLEKATAIGNKLNASTDAQTAKKLTEEYNKLAKKALPHLEKAQACDPSDETLNLIKIVYKNIKDPEGLDTLNSRLKKLSANCVEILEDK